jgi:hypothetical protein
VLRRRFAMVTGAIFDVRGTGPRREARRSWSTSESHQQFAITFSQRLQLFVTANVDQAFDWLKQPGILRRQ